MTVKGQRQRQRDCERAETETAREKVRETGRAQGSNFERGSLRGNELERERDGETLGKREQKGSERKKHVPRGRQQLPGRRWFVVGRRKGQIGRAHV